MLIAATSPILLAAVVGLPLTVVPVLIRWMDNRRDAKKETKAAERRKEEREADWKRTDDVAAEALRGQQEVAREAIRQQEAVAAEAIRRQEAVRVEAKKVADEAVARLAETAAISKRRQDESDRKLGEVARLAEEANHATEDQLKEMKVVVDQTHVLVNSNMMRELRKGLAGLKAQRILLERIFSMNEAQGRVPSEEDLEASAILRSEIKDSEEVLVDLIARTRVAEKIAEAAESGEPPESGAPPAPAGAPDSPV